MKSKILKSKDELFGIEFVFEDYKHYHDLLENHLSETIKQFEERHNENSIIEEAKKEAEIQSEYLSYLLDQYNIELFKLSFRYPSNLRASFLTQIISFIEFELRSICEHHHLLNKTDFSVNDLQGNSDTQKAKKYLSKAAKIDFNKLNPEWSVINTIIKLRNKFVHNQGTIDESHTDWGELDLFINNNNFIELMKLEPENVFDETINYSIIITKRGLNDKLINDTENFFKKLLMELK